MPTTTKLCLLSALAISGAAADSLTVVNPNFANVAVQCNNGFAYQSTGGNCSGPNTAQQNFNAAIGIGWTFASFAPQFFGPGMLSENSDYGPPPFTGLPFTQAALLQGSGTAVGQTITGFVPNGSYTLSIYLGSRYASAPNENGNQAVEATIDGQAIATWDIISFTAFAVQTAPFTVITGGSHTLAFTGLNSGDHTAFFSGVSIATTGGLAVAPSTGEPGMGLVASGGGFAPLEAVNLVAYASAPVVIGTANADLNGNIRMTGHVPQSPFGSCGLQAIGQSSGAVVSGTISLRPRASVSPSSGGSGSAITLTAFGFAAGETVGLEWSSPQTSLGTVRANKNGTISAQFAIPAGARAGTDGVTARGQKTGATASAQIAVQ